MKWWLSSLLFRVAIVNIVGGMWFGWLIGSAPIFLSFDGFERNCTMRRSALACTEGAGGGSGCNWIANPGVCNFSRQCPEDWPSSACSSFGNGALCFYDHSSKMCRNIAGFSAVESGVFASAMVVGAFLGSLGAGILTTRIGTKRTFYLIALSNALLGVFFHFGLHFNVYWMLVLGRVALGTVVSLACFACPNYVEQMADEALRPQLGVLFQIFCTFGILLAAFSGWLLAPSNFHSELKMNARSQGFTAIGSFVSVLFWGLGLAVLPRKPSSLLTDDSIISDYGEHTLLNSETSLSKGGTIDDHSNHQVGWTSEDSSPKYVQRDSIPNLNSPDESSRSTYLQNIADNFGKESDAYTWGDMIVPLIAATALSFAGQFTGINAIMNYAPKIAEAVGLDALTGNFAIMFWNFITTLISLPVSRRASTRSMFLCGTLCASLSCLLTGIPLFPALHVPRTLKNALSGSGIMLFISAFEVGIGPSFWILSQVLFPLSFRPKGSSYTVAFQFILNIIVNFTFPIAVQGLSGGPGEDQDLGMGIVFIIFASCGVCAFVVLLRVLHEYTETKVSAKAM